MPYYKEINLLFIHIPKTGGTSLEFYLKSKYNETLYSGYTNDILPTKEFQNKSLQHLPYNIIYQYKNILDVDFNENLKIITIVRNPYDKIISDLFFFFLITINENLTIVFEKIEKYLYNDNCDNHNIPQYKFITDNNGNLISNIKILKTECLTEQLKEYGFNDYEYLGILKGPEIVINYRKYLNNDSIKLINNFYKKDFELFDYDMINCK